MKQLMAFALLTVLAAGCGTTGLTTQTDPDAGNAPMTEVSVPDERESARGQDGTSEAARALARELPCLPAAIDPAFLAWPVLSFRPLMVRTVDESVLAGAWVLYGREDERVAVVWAGGQLIAVDPHPLSDGPLWINEAMLDEHTHEILSHGNGPCRWSREGDVQV